MFESVASLRRVAAVVPKARASARRDLALAALAGLALGLGVLAFGGRAMGALSRLWSDNVLPAYLDMYLNGLPMC